MPQIVGRSDSEASTLDRPSNSQNASQTRQPGTVHGAVASAAIAGMFVIIVIIAWTQGWFGFSYVQAPAARTSASHMSTTPGNGGIAADNLIGKKRNKEI